MRPTSLIAIGAVGIFVLWRYATTQSDNILSTITGDIQQGADVITTKLTGWNTNKIPAEYREIISYTEQANGIPSGMLARLLYQESHYRADIIDGTTKSPAGALGIAQFMPATAAQYGVDPLNTDSAIQGAGKYLATLYRNLGAWDKALAAYNWGIGNVQRKGLAAAPQETVTYYTSILQDIGYA